MPAVTKPAVSMYLGEDKDITDTIYQADGVSKQDITGWSVTASLHSYNDPSTAIFTKTTAGGGVLLTDPANGLMTILVTAADTAPVVPDMYQLSVRRTDTGAITVLTLVDFELLQK